MTFTPIKQLLAASLLAATLSSALAATEADEHPVIKRPFKLAPSAEDRKSVV